MDKTELLKKYSALPKITKEVLASPEFTDACINIGKKHNIIEENYSNLTNIIIYRVVGLLNKNSFKEKIRVDLKIIEPNLSALCADIEENIVNSITKIYNESLKNIEATLKNVGVDFVSDLYLSTKEEPEMILDKNIEQRVFEISTKYDLNKDQTQELINNVSKYINDKDSGVTPESIALDIGISKIVAEQVAQDIESRIFNYINKTEKNPVAQTQSSVTEQTTASKSTSASVPVYSPKPVIVLDKEPVQTPVSVPRFKAVPMDDNEIVGSNFIPNLTPKPNAIGIMQAKMDTAEPKTPAPEPKKANYSVDPYREPIS